jgi:hypothetical protein
VDWKNVERTDSDTKIQKSVKNYKKQFTPTEDITIHLPPELDMPEKPMF